MHVSVLASGSKGNCTFVVMNNTLLLVDAGISARRINTSLKKLGVDIHDVNGVIITHEHSDHINGLTTLCKKYKLPLYSRTATFRAMPCLDKLPLECLHPIEDEFQIGNIAIRAFAISHDAVDPVGYNLFSKQQKCTIATDLGFVTSTVQEALDNSDVLVLEANHDRQMLKNGSYPFVLKQRIMGSRGHLANSDAAWALVRMKKHNPYVFLAHISEKNNRLELIKNTVSEIIEAQGIKIGTDIRLKLANQQQMVSIEY